MKHKRAWKTFEEKLAIVRDFANNDMRSEDMAAKYEISTTSLFKWVGQVRRGKLRPPQPRVSKMFLRDSKGKRTLREALSLYHNLPPTSGEGE